jgi:hypothetical protein
MTSTGSGPPTATADSTGNGRSSGLELLPVTERVLVRLPGTRVFWTVFWAFLTAIRPLIFLQVLWAMGHASLGWEFVRTQLSSHAVYAYMVLVSFWAARKIAREARALEPSLQRLASPSARTGNVFAGMTSVAGPVALTVLLTIVLSINLLGRWGAAPAAIILPYLAVPIFPIMTMFWVYVSVLVGLDRLGRQPMELGVFPEDTSLGLRPVGALAFTAFLVFCAETLPFLLVNLRDRLQLILGLCFFVAGVVVFFLSMWRLHRQMMAAKARHLAWVRALYGEAFAPIRPRPTLEGLQARAPLVSAAEALEKRALSIQEWPFDDRTMARIVAVSTGVVTTTLARFVMRAVGL